MKVSSPGIYHLHTVGESRLLFSNKTITDLEREISHFILHGKIFQGATFTPKACGMFKQPYYWSIGSTILGLDFPLNIVQYLDILSLNKPSAIYRWQSTNCVWPQRVYRASNRRLLSFPPQKKLIYGASTRKKRTPTWLSRQAQCQPTTTTSPTILANMNAPSAAFTVSWILNEQAHYSLN